MMIIDDVLKAFELNSGADIGSLETFATVFGFAPPPDYLEFMRRSNGGEGFVRTRYLVLWPLEELRQHNEGYEVPRYAPGLFVFGTNGGGEAFAFDLRRPKSVIVSVPLIGMSLDEVSYCGDSFGEFLQELAKEQAWG